MTTAVNIRGRLAELLPDPNFVYVGRTGWYTTSQADIDGLRMKMPPEWCAKHLRGRRVWLISNGFGNKFRIGPHGDRNQVLETYKLWLRTNPAMVTAAREELRGKVLGCWCLPSACHASVLVEVADSESLTVIAPPSQPLSFARSTSRPPAVHLA
jgi:hypothetical protein